MSKVYLIHRRWDRGYGGEVMGATSDKKIADAFLNQNEKYDKKAKTPIYMVCCRRNGPGAQFRSLRKDKEREIRMKTSDRLREFKYAKPESLCNLAWDSIIEEVRRLEAELFFRNHANDAIIDLFYEEFGRPDEDEDE